ncbi:MAG: TetR family transcriptional regulator [bacterium]|nr:MAG: TetR family transcriptional regulator [bacterium]
MVKLERKKSILLSAEELFAEKGFFSTSVADIIKHAGIARGTFYLYFDSKKTIFDALLDDLLASVNHAIKRIDIHASPDPLTQLKDNIMRIATLLNERRNLTKILLTYATGIDEDSDKKIRFFYQEILKLIESALTLGTEMAILRPCKAKLVAACILGSIKEVAYSFINMTNPIDDIEVVVDEIIQFALVGLLIH